MFRFCVLLFILFQSVDVFAGSKYNSQTGSKDFCQTIRNQSGTVISDKCEEIRVTDGYLTNEGNFYLVRSQAAMTSGVVSMTTAQTAISPSYSLIKKAIASSANPGFSTGTLSNGRQGQIITILITEVGAGGTWTVTPTTKTGFTSLVFEAVGDLQTLLYVDDTVGWIRLTRESVQTN